MTANKIRGSVSTSSQDKVSEEYSPEIACKKVTHFFQSHPETALIINSLSRTKVCVLAALLDGKSITTSGYSIQADYGIKRASALIYALDKLHYFPISSKLISTPSEIGTLTKQSIFFITEEDREKLKRNPEAVFKKRHDNARSVRASQAEKVMKRLVKEYGEDGVLELLKVVVSNSDSSGTSAS